MRTGCWDCLRSRIDLFEVTMLNPMAFGAFVALFVMKGSCRILRRFASVMRLELKAYFAKPETL